MSKIKIRRKKRYYSDIEKQAMVDKFLSGGLSKSDFCKQEHISESALYRWQRDLPQCSEVVPAFIPVETSTTIGTEAKLLHIKLTHGIEFSIPEGFSPSYVAKIVKELSHAND